MRFVTSFLVVAAAITLAPFLFKEPKVDIPLYSPHGEKVVAPRLAGLPLQIFTVLLENSVIGPMLLGHILRDNKMQMVKQFADTLTNGPVIHPLYPETNDSADWEMSPEVVNYDLVGNAANDFRYWTSQDYIAAYKSGRTTPTEVAKNLIEAIRASEAATPPLRAFVQINEDMIMKAAEEATEIYRSGGAVRPLEGVPVGVKEELAVTGYKHRCGTTFLGGDEAVGSAAEAESVAYLRAAGAMIVGVTNMHEIGIGTTGHNVHNGPSRNPHDVARHTGGSSGGSAAAVAAGLVPIAVGVDGGGSIRIPAAVCGVHGLKPTYDAVSPSGGGPLGWSLAHVGPIAGSTADLALAYAIMAGKLAVTTANATSTLLHPRATPLTSPAGIKDLSDITIGVYWPYFNDADPEVVSRAVAALEALKDRGAVVKEVAIPHLKPIKFAHSVTILSEMATATLPFMEQHGTDFSLESRVNLAIGRHFSASYLYSALKIRAYSMEVFRELFTQVDVLVTPSIGIAAPLIPADALLSGESDLDKTNSLMKFAAEGNFAGVPGITIPVGHTGTGGGRSDIGGTTADAHQHHLPVGLQFQGRPHEEGTLLRLSAAVDAEIPLVSSVENGACGGTVGCRVKPVVHFSPLN